MRTLFLLIALSVISACQSLSLELATPFKRVAEAEADRQYLVVVTEARFRGEDHREDRFNRLVKQITDDIENTPGLYGYSIRRDFLGNAAWTYTIWESEAAMSAFKTSDHHVQAMGAATDVLVSAKFARTSIATAALPYSWEEALDLLASKGRVYQFSDSAASL